MASRSATRRRKRGAQLSSDEEENSTSSGPERHYSSRKGSIVHKHRSQLQLEPLPEGILDEASIGTPETKSNKDASSSILKPQSPVGKSSGPSGKAQHGTIYNFFAPRKLSENQESSHMESSEDIIDDGFQKTVEDNVIRTPQHKDHSKNPSVHSNPAAGSKKQTFRNQKFIINSVRPSIAEPLSRQCGRGQQRTWVEEYTPIHLEDLAVHKKKVEDVKGWLNNVLNGRERKMLLVLRGPSGSGKTATINALSVTLGFEVIEWHNPVGQNSDASGFVPLSNQFRDFLERSRSYGGLALEQTKPHTSTPLTGNSRTFTQRSKVILLEELPYTLSKSKIGLDTFRSCILHYLTANLPNKVDDVANGSRLENGIIPMVVLVSENSNTSLAGSESMTAHRLLGTEILGHRGTTIIDFNRVAPTILSKALNTILDKSLRGSGRSKALSADIMKMFSQGGDVRQAIHALEFFYLTGESKLLTAHNHSKNKRKRHSERTITSNEKTAIDNIIHRSDSLDLFHAVGKVVYNKRSPRNETSLNDVCTQEAYSPDLVSEVDVDQLVDESSTDASTFTAALHENFVLSCNGHDFVDSLNGCLEFISDADLLGCSPTGSTVFQNTSQGSSTNRYNYNIDSAYQADMALHTAVRGLLSSLPYPVQRGMPGRSSRETVQRDTYKMYYPESMRLGKEREENEELIGYWLKMLQFDPNVELGLKLATPNDSSQLDDSRNPRLLSWDLQMSRSRRTELVVNVLPYLVKIVSKTSGSSSSMCALSKFVDFGEHKVNEASQKTQSLWGSRSKTAGYQTTNSAGLSMSPHDSQKLVLSDDDIED